jgi:deoxyribodipyrimidine photo-lyase
MKSLCWIRRDLRLHDHAALSAALRFGETHLVFIFDTHILEKLKNKEDRRLTFIYQSLVEIEVALQKKGSSLHILYGKPEEEIPKLAQKLMINRVFTNRDYEPYAKDRDSKVEKKLKASGIEFESFKDQVFFEKHQVVKDDRSIYKVFTPYKNKWLGAFEELGKNIPDFACPLKNFAPFSNPQSILTHDFYKVMGFKEALPDLAGGTKAALQRLKKFSEIMSDYKEARDFPAIEGTSLLSVYIRFGNLSIRDMIRVASASRSEGAKTWFSELIWREFYFMILDTHPYIVKESFKRDYDKIKWLGKPEHFKAWCEGSTGVPIIDAAMRCFNATGMMHNRLRMIVASYLIKILLIDWREGEAYFAEKLLDFDLAANNGGWQWSSSSGCDAQPYFRIFNPYTQSEKFDSQGEFIKQWCPELAHLSGKQLHRPEHVTPIVSYEKNRERCLEMYAVVKA